MAFYNSAIYMGRALSFAAVIVAGQLGMKHSELGVTMVSPCYLAAFAVWDWSTLGFAGIGFAAYLVQHIQALQSLLQQL